MTDQQIPPYKEFAIGVTVRAGSILKRNFYDHLRMTPKKKSRNEVVTDSDIELNDFMQHKVRNRFSEHNYISEEGKNVDTGSQYTWVVDPLDGTLNYTIGNPFFSTSMVLLDDGEPIISVVYAPLLNELFICEREHGVRLNEREMTVSQEENLQDAVMSFSYFYRDKESRSRSLNLWNEFEDRSRGMRHLGCTTLELAYVASGRIEACVIAPPLRLWDVAAGKIMVEEAGGIITDFAGEPWKDVQQGFVATNGAVHESVMNVLDTTKI